MDRPSALLDDDTMMATRGARAASDLPDHVMRVRWSSRPMPACSDARWRTSPTTPSAIPGDQVAFEVRDDGPGNPEEVRARIFDRYVHVSSVSSASMNRGLGLTFVTPGCA